ncbi:MAG: aldehyde ferredoxin oxidoreductase family protein [Chloroflexota bacterium]
MHGYHGRLLWVDLVRGQVRDEPLDADYAARFVGGSGLATRYLYDLIQADTDPLGPDNPLIVMPGPLTGTQAPLCGRHTLVGRSPLTGLLGESNVGGFFGAELRHAGYDGIVITGQAAAPVWLHIHDGQAELHAANELWGLDTLETQRHIKESLADRRVRVGCIGPAGENLVRYAGIFFDNARAAARTGLGAVMGAKRLKALAVRGTGGVPVADEPRFNATARQMKTIFKEDVVSQILRTTGTGGNLDYLHLLGALPVRYFTQGEWWQAAEISGNIMAETILTGVEGCYGCLVACGRQVTVTEGKYATNGEIKGPEYETLGALGSQLLIDDLAAVTHLGHLCDRLGLDSLSTGNTLALAHYFFQEGILGPSETGGVSLQWGDADTVADLIRQIAHRQGLGDALAEGSRRFAERFGAAEWAVHFNGMEPAMHDPRAYSGMALAYATSPIGGSHNHSDYYWVESGRVIEELDITSPGRHQDAGKAVQVARHQNWNSLINALVTCIFSNAPATGYIQLLNAATGRDLDAEGALAVGERIFNLKRALNIKLGYTRAGERLPGLLRQPHTEGGTEGFVPDEALLFREYYQARAWDLDSGKPLKHKLEALGLTEIAADVWPD